MGARIVRKLTNRVVATYIPREREYTVFDFHVRRLGLRVQPNGARSWVVRGQVQGRAVRLTLGSARRLNADQARVAAREALAAGFQPQLPGSKTPTFEDFGKYYYKARARDWCTESRRTFLCRMKCVLLPAFSSFRIGLISHADVARWFYNYSRRRPGNANRALGYMKAMLYAARDWGYLPDGHANPCMRIRNNRLPPRGRFINKDGLKRLAEVLKQGRGDVPRPVDVVELLMLTGCRLCEILTLRWAYVQSDRLLLPRTKTGPRVVPLGHLAQACLRRLRRLSKSAFVFPSRFLKGKPMHSIDYAWRKIRQKAQLSTDIRVHDLRHSYVSHCLLSGETIFTAGALVGHRRMESTARYAHLADAHLLEVADRIAQRIHKWMTVGPVTASRARAARR